jgi:MFS family permease
MAIEIPRDFRRVIIAASVGNVIEWYDFYIFGSLAAVLSVKFFEQSHPVAALLSTIALFTAGFLIRPLGAFLFGWMATGWAASIRSLLRSAEWGWAPERSG